MTQAHHTRAEAVMSIGRLFAILISIGLVLLGLIFIIAALSPQAASPGGRAFIGSVIAGIGLFLFVFILRQKAAPGGAAGTVIQQKIELSGDVQLESLACARCGGAITQEHITVKAGAPFVQCPFCGSNYQLEEKPKW